MNQNEWYAPANTIKLNQWQHIAVTYVCGDTNAKMYYNGQQVTATKIHSNLANCAPDTNAKYFGAAGASQAAAFDGTIDDVRIYNRALTAQEVKRLYNIGGTLHVGASQNQKITNGLVGMWSFDQADIAGVKAYDRSGKGNDGTLTNGPKQTVGVIGQALSFDGVDDNVDLGNPTALQLTGSMSISAWAYANSFPTNDANLISKDKSSDHGWGLVKSVDNGPAQMAFIVGCSPACAGSNSGAVRYSASTITTKKWYHFVGVYNAPAQTMHIYVNGILDDGILSTTPNSSQQNSGSNVYMGQNGDGNSFWSGQIDAVRIYNRALTAQEVKRLYNMGGTLHVGASQNQKITNGLVGLWSFDQSDIAGTVAYDRSGQGNNGTLTNGPKQTIGKLGQGLTFNGTTNVIQVPANAAFNLTGDLTVSAWIKPNSFGGGSNGRIIDHRDDAVDFNNGFGFLVNDVTVTKGLRLYATGGDDAVSNSNVITLGVWQHVVATRSGTTVTFYVNGANAGTATLTTITSAPNDPLYIGNDEIAGLDRGFDGTIDDVRIYNRALSPSEVKRLYNMGHAN